MGLFDDHIARLRTFLDQPACRRESTVIDLGQISTAWPAGGPNNLVLSTDMAVELGSPRTASTAFLVWTEQADRLANGRLTLVGPDIPEESRALVPFGKAVL
ncbi:MAG: hypothetical protein ACLFPD_01485, partial [Desulfosudaceae bacterium]